VAGDGSCPELAEVGHCRIARYTPKPAQLFRPTHSGRIRQEWTDVLRKEKETHKTGESSIVVFQIGEEWLALPTAIMREVSRFARSIACRTGQAAYYLELSMSEAKSSSAFRWQGCLYRTGERRLPFFSTGAQRSGRAHDRDRPATESGFSGRKIPWQSSN